ncbi:embryogenesis-associated protein emb8 [Quercus suber]|uniref:Embryogenesis-associated protein emb8 n=1 Tax=Quercus suber TaxID=58331 RepID=A0AAW0KZV1_QUESU
MAVGWEYGANMLTKYLAEAGENTPLIAAMCIDNPFDLEEATRSSPYHMAIEQKLTGGLIDILRSNKELFQGKAKGFDMEKALLAKFIHDFEKAIYIYGILAQETWLRM